MKEKTITKEAILVFVNGSEITKELLISYKQTLIEQGYAVASINSMLSSINSLLTWLGWLDYHVKTIKVQRQVFCSEERELTRDEYQRLLETAHQNGNERLYLILQTICGTGI